LIPKSGLLQVSMLKGLSRSVKAYFQKDSREKREKKTILPVGKPARDFVEGFLPFSGLPGR